jgi:hypothetical protein
VESLGAVRKKIAKTFQIADGRVGFVGFVARHGLSLDGPRRARLNCAIQDGCPRAAGSRRVVVRAADVGAIGCGDVDLLLRHVGPGGGQQEQ